MKCVAIKGVKEFEVKEIEKPEKADGVINDREKRQLILTVTYKPKTIDERSSSYNTLVTDTAYKWDKTYKPAVGNEQTEKTVIKNEHTIDIVSGEIALQVVFDSKVAEILENQTIEYKIGLYRSYNGKKEQIGTFTASYDGKTPIEFDDDGNFILKANFEYLDKSMANKGLPLGTYTVEEPSINAPNYIKFDQINNVQNADRYKQELFTVGTDYTDPAIHLAVFENDTNIILGKKESDDKYLNERFGLFEVKPIAAFEMPVAGNNSLVMVYATAIACIMIATMLHISIKIRKKRK